jgi:hypothetical protein
VRHIFGGYAQPSTIELLMQAVSEAFAGIHHVETIEEKHTMKKPVYGPE